MTDIFCYGANEGGIHGMGAARYALINEGAVMYKYGFQGTSYGIPTKDEKIQTLPLLSILKHIEDFKNFAASHLELTFNVTRIGCGLAGYLDFEMAPLFKGLPSNCKFPTEWKHWLGDSVLYHDLH